MRLSGDVDMRRHAGRHSYTTSASSGGDVRNEKTSQGRTPEAPRTAPALQRVAADSEQQIKLFENDGYQFSLMTDFRFGKGKGLFAKPNRFCRRHHTLSRQGNSVIAATLVVKCHTVSV